MSISLSDITNIFDNEMHSCRDKIKQTLEFHGELAYIRNEFSVTEYEKKYIIEIISPEKENVDDYGIAIDLTLQDIVEKIICQVDVLKSYGQIFSEHTFEIAKKE